MRNEAAHRNDELAHALVTSMCAPLINMIKLCIAYPSKNRMHAGETDLVCAIDMLGKCLLPDYCMKHVNDLEKLNRVHDMLVYLFNKARKVFQSGVISAVINNNRDIDAFKRCLFEIL